MTDIQLAPSEFEVVRFATTELKGANHQSASPMGEASLEAVALRWEDAGEKFDRIASFDLLKGVATVDGSNVSVVSQPFNESGYLYIGAIILPTEDLPLVMTEEDADTALFNLGQAQADRAAMGRTGSVYPFERANGDRVIPSLERLR